MSTTRAAVYARRSTEKQDASITSQRKACESYAEAEGMTVVSTYEDTASGWKPDTPRPGFDRMMADAQAGTFDVLITWELSRLSRQEDDQSALALVWDLRGHGVEVASVSEPSTGVRFADDMFTLYRSHVAAQESKDKSKRTRRGMRDLAREGKWRTGRPPYGYRIGEDRTLNVEPDEAEVVRFLFKSVAAGESIAAVGRDLNAREVPGPTGGAWQRGTLRAMLSNATYAASLTYTDEDGNEVSAPGAWDAIIDADTWAAVQNVRRANAAMARTTTGNITRLLTGYITCYQCGRGLIGNTRRGKAYYQCSRTSGCGGPSITAEPADAYITDVVLTMLADGPDLLDRLLGAEDDTEVADLADELASVRARADQLVDDHYAGLVDRAQFTRVKRTLDATLTSLRDRIDRKRNTLGTLGAVPFGDYEALCAWWEDADQNTRRDLLGIVLTEVKLSPGRRGGTSTDVAGRLDVVWSA